MLVKTFFCYQKTKIQFFISSGKLSNVNKDVFNFSDSQHCTVIKKVFLTLINNYNIVVITFLKFINVVINFENYLIWFIKNNKYNFIINLIWVFKPIYFYFLKVNIFYFKGDINMTKVIQILLNNLLIYGVKNNQQLIVRMFGKYTNTNVCVNDYYNDNPLIYAVRKGYLEIVELLLTKGVNLEHGDNGGGTALIWATKNGHLSIVEKLLARGADIHNENQSIDRLLFFAASNNKLEMVNFLLEHNAKFNYVNQIGDAALMYAALNGHLSMVELLLANGADVKYADSYGNTALIWAASRW